MKTTKLRSGRFARATLAVLAVSVLGLAGCRDALTVTNPGAIEATNLNDPFYINLMVNGVVSQFQYAHGQVLRYASVLGDELRNGHVYTENIWIDQRTIDDNNNTAASIYSGLQRARFLGDSVAGRLKVLLGDSASRDFRLARVLAYAGYSYVYLGELYCTTPINMSAAKTDDEVLAMALPRFDEAITVATAAKAWAQGHTADATYSAATLAAMVAGSDSILNLARVGAARAAMDLNKKDQAIAYASAVTPAWTSDASAASKGFQFWVYWADETTGKWLNPMWSVVSIAAGKGTREASLWRTPYENINDARVPMDSMTGGVMDSPGGTPANAMIPLAPSSYSNWTGVIPGQEVKKNSNVRMASAIEARYVLAEAQGPTQVNVDFINSRRALTVSGGPSVLPGQQLTVGMDATTFRDAVLEQRTLDLFLDGHRVGDIRRYKKYYSLNFWPTGPYPGSSTGVVYGTSECFPIPLSEKNANPNL